MKLDRKYRVIAMLIALIMVLTSIPFNSVQASDVQETLPMETEGILPEENPLEETEPGVTEAVTSEKDTETEPAVPVESEEEEPSPADEATAPEEDETQPDPEAAEEAATEGADEEPDVMGENPDHLPGPVEVPAPVIQHLSPASPFGFARRFAPMADAMEPGEVKLEKTATPVDGMVNTWDIELKIQAKDTQQTSDVVLVIDTSGSMNDYNRLAAAKTAAKQFVNQILAEGSSSAGITRIAIVSFAGGVRTNQLLTDNKDHLLYAIDNLSAGGGTYTQAGVRQAAALLQGTNANHKHIVLLSDGEPTYSYGLKSPRTWATYEYTTHRFETTSAMETTEFNYDRRIGNGTSLRTWFDRDGIFDVTNYYYNHGNSAIAEARYARNAGNTLYTIAYSAGTDGTAILNGMASPGKAYNSTPADIDQVLGQIAGEIQSTVRAGTVSDPMGQGFVVDGSVSDITVSQGTVTLAEDGKSINWTIGNMTSPANSDVKVATLKYRVTIDDDILTATPDGAGEYPTNGDTRLTFTNSDGASQTKAFPVPWVNPVLLVLEKVLKDASGEVIEEDNREFIINVRGGAGHTDYDQDYILRAGERRIATNLRWAVEYTVSEPDVNPEDYDITIQPASFALETGDTKDYDITVTNQEKPLGKLTVKKVFSSIPNVVSGVELLEESVRLLAEPLSFDFVLTHPDGTKEEFTLKAGGSEVFENLPYGSYKVVEKTTEGFTTVYDPADGVVELTFDKREGTVTVTNTVTENPDITATKVWDDANPSLRQDIWFKLYRESEKEEKRGVAGAEIKKVPAGDGNTFTVSWQGLPEYDPQGYPYTYSVQEVYENGDNMVPVGYTKQEEGLTVTNKAIKDSDPANITSIRFEKTWDINPEDIPEDWDGKITVEVYNKATGEVVRTAQLTYPDTVVEWKNLPYTDADGKVIDYGIRETGLPGWMKPSDPVETPSAIESIELTKHNSNTNWDIKNPSFVITRTTQNGPFVIWTLNHLPENQREQFLLNIFAYTGNNPGQPITDLQNNWQTTPIIWIEGPQVSYDVFPSDDNAGMITVDIQFDEDGTISSSNLIFQGQSTWIHFAVGTYSSKEVAITNSYDAGEKAVHVEKKWVTTSAKPESIIIKLLADDVVIDELELNAANDWKGSFTDLPVYNKGVKIAYTIEEVEVPGYVTSIKEVTLEGDDQKFIVTNTSIFIPPTGISLDSLPYLLLLATVAVAAGFTLVRRKNRRIE